MVNCIIKLSILLPLSKPDKPRELIDTYRPINNLPCLEKIFEAHVLTHLNNYLNEIIVPYHYGGHR